MINIYEQGSGSKLNLNKTKPKACDWALNGDKPQAPLTSYGHRPIQITRDICEI